MSQSTSITIHPLGKEISGTIEIPGSKSYTNRAIVLAICAIGETIIQGALNSDDTLSGISVAQKLGCKVTRSEDSITIRGIGRERPVPQAEIDVRSAGTIARFLPPLLAFGQGGQWTLTASEQMTRRPIDGLVNALQQLDKSAVEYLAVSGYYPIEVHGGKISTHTVAVDGSISSQYLSGLLLAAPLLEQGLEIHVSTDIVQSSYVDMTTDYMQLFGIEVDSTPDMKKFIVSSGEYHGISLQIEADASTSTYFAALPAILGGSIELVNLQYHSRQPDIRFLEILTQFGCTVTPHPKIGVHINRPIDCKILQGGHKFNLNDCSDIALTVAALSVFANNPVEITGIEHIRHHECDRIAAMTQALTQMGVPVEERADGWKIWPAQPKPITANTYSDHRMAMALTIIGLGAEGITLDDAQCVDKTCPNFFELMGSLGVQYILH